MHNADVSTIIPTFHREKEVVLAVRSALEQRDVTVECIVLDDSPEGSAREAVESIADERVRYVKRDVPTGGKPAVVRNEGVPFASGRYLHFMDDDDLVAEGAYAGAVAALDANPDRGVSVGWVVPFGDDSEWLEDKATYFAEAGRRGARNRNSLVIVGHILFRGTLMVNSACMIRRELFSTLGGYDSEIPVYEDIDFWLRAIRRFGHVYIDRPMLLYRIGRPSLMHNLGHDETLVVQSNNMIHSKYKQAHGQLEYRLLQAACKLVPDVVLRQIPA